jgi:cell division protease FtsH
MEDNRNNGGNNNQPDNNRHQKGKQTIIIIVIAAIITIIASTIMSSLLSDATTKEETYNEFLEQIENNKIDEVTFSTDGKIYYSKKDEKNGYFEITYWTAQLNDDDLLDKLDESGVKYKGEIEDKQSSIVTFLLEWILPFAFIYLIMGLLFRRVSKNSGMMGVGKSNAKVYVEKETGVTFADVAGQDEAKESLTEIVDFLHNPGKYSRIGAKLPKGALLVGPPGTGKTLLAKAVAGEAKVPFFSLSGSDFVEMFVGVGASRVRDLFKQAQASAPCIIFIDEIDAIGKSRDSKYGGGNDEREQTLNQLLSEMDGFDTSKGLFILAATNRPEVLDKALLRPGRFDRRIIVDKPDLKGRYEVLKVHSRNVSMDETVDLNAIALATSGAVGSDLANMINEAAINAVKNGRNAISQADLLESVEVVIAGKEKKDRILGSVEKKTVAYHEVGHALITALEKNSEPVQKITIVPRTMGSLGYVMQVPEEEKYLMTKDELITRIVTLLGGRASEELVFDSVTTGASNDMEKATRLARNMITQYGMSDKFGLMSLEEVENQYLSGSARLNCSDATAAQVDEEVKILLKKCYEKAKELLSANREALDKIAEYLYEKETITGKEFMEIFNEVKGNEVKDNEVNVSEVKDDEAKDNEVNVSEVKDTVTE